MLNGAFPAAAVIVVLRVDHLLDHILWSVIDAHIDTPNIFSDQAKHKHDNSAHDQADTHQ